jgi:hypothetical protein
VPKSWNATHPKKLIELGAQWRKEHPEKFSAFLAKRNIGLKKWQEDQPEEAAYYQAVWKAIGRPPTPILSDFGISQGLSRAIITMMSWPTTS